MNLVAELLLAVLKVTTPFCRFCQLLQNFVAADKETTHVGRKENPINNRA